MSVAQRRNPHRPSPRPRNHPANLGAVYAFAAEMLGEPLGGWPLGSRRTSGGCLGDSNAVGRQTTFATTTAPRRCDRREAARFMRNGRFLFALLSDHEPC